MANQSPSATGFLPMPPAATAATEYMLDAWQRTILTWDVLRQRGNEYLEHEKSGNPPVLVFDYEMVVDGRTLAKPANYALVRIKPPADCPPADPKKRPFVVIDPRAGHGPGIGGFKIDSEIGIALKFGHPCLLRDVLSAAGAGADHRIGVRRRGRVPAQGRTSCTRRPKASPSSSATARAAGRC